MGTSTNAILYFGFDFCSEDDGDELPWGAESDWEEVYGEKLLGKDTSGLWTPEGDYAVPEGAERNRREKVRDAWTDKKDKLVKKSGARIDFHCSHDFPIWYVSLEKHHHQAYRGHPEKIDPAALAVSDDEIQKLRVFCEVMGIKWKQPRWLLASYWG